MELSVLMNGHIAGTLSYTPAAHLYAFRYSAEWLSRKDRYALSPTLPLVEVEQGSRESHSAAVRQFFENLLPEGQALDVAASTYRLSKGNLMGLLAALGGETAGALQLRLPGAATPSEAETFRWLSHEELSERIEANVADITEGARLALLAFAAASAGDQEAASALAQFEWESEGVYLAFDKPKEKQLGLADSTIRFFDLQENKTFVGTPAAPGGFHTVLADAIKVWTELDRLKVNVTPEDLIDYEIFN